jgi:hypothetical protein
MRGIAHENNGQAQALPSSQSCFDRRLSMDEQVVTYADSPLILGRSTCALTHGADIRLADLNNRTRPFFNQS